MNCLKNAGWPRLILVQEFYQNPSLMTGAGLALAVLPILSSKMLTGGGIIKRGAPNQSAQLALSGRQARDRLRSALDLKTGGGLEAHHLIPWQFRDHELLEKAARGGFDINGAANGMGLNFTRHRGLNIYHHQKYNEAIGKYLDWINSTYPNLTDRQAAELLAGYAAQLRSAIDKTRSQLR